MMSYSIIATARHHLARECDVEPRRASDSHCVKHESTVGELEDESKKSSLEGSLEFLPLQRVRIRPDGGLSHFLYKTNEASPPLAKYFGAFTNTLVLGYNVVLLLWSASAAISDVFVPLILHDSEDGYHHFVLPPKKSPGLHFLTGQVGYLDFRTRHSMVAVFECGGLAYYFVTFLRLLFCAISHPKNDSENHECWHSIAEIFWSLQPSVRCFSAMRVLKKVHPHVLNVEVRHMLNRINSSPDSSRRRALHFTLFFAKRALLLYFGFQAFLYKFTVTADSVHSGKLGPVSQIATCLGFLNQLVGGVVQLDILMKQRVMLLLFGGQDAFMDLNDSVIMSMWLARLTKAIYTRSFIPYGASYSEMANVHSGGGHGKIGAMLWWCRLRFFICMSTWNHLDFQKLLCEDCSDVVNQQNSMLWELGKHDGWRRVVQHQPYFEFQ